MIEHFLKTKISLQFVVFLSLSILAITTVKAGYYVEGSAYEPYYRVNKSSSDLVAWATKVVKVQYGSAVDDQWKTPEKALGPATGDLYDIVSLGRGGSIVLTFDRPIRNGPGWDFAVFENGFVYSSSNLSFLELAYVEVSTDGVNFVRFDSVSLNRSPVGEYSGLDHTNIHNLASKYPCGYGTPFDLYELSYKDEVKSGVVDLNNIRFVRLIDIVGNGSSKDCLGQVIYDPYPTNGSAGFDLEAVGVRYQAAPVVVKGDINGNGVVDEEDETIALEVLAGKKPAGIRDSYPSSGADINGDGRIGMEELLYIMTKLSD